jgi:hypothetical protein
MARLVRTIPFTPDKTFTLGDLEARTGLSKRTLQNWGNTGVIVADSDTLHGGRGSVRRFAVTELVIAVLLSPLARAGVTVGHLERLAGVLRQSLDVRQPGSVLSMYEPGTPAIGRALVRAIAGRGGHNFLIVAFTPELVLVEPVTDEAPDTMSADSVTSVPTGAAKPPTALFDLVAFLRDGGPRPPRFGYWLDLAPLAGLFDI